MPLSAAQASDYARDGYLVRADLVAPHEVAQLVEETERVVRGDYPVANARPGDPISTVYAPHAVSPVIRDFIRHPGVVDTVSRLAAAHRAGWDGSTKFVQSTLFIKPPGCPGHPWHQDCRSIETADQSVVGAWVALDRATVETGCMWALPGTHRTGYLWPTRPHGDREYDFRNEAFGFDSSGAVPLEVDPGTVVFFSGTLLHCSRANRGTTTRRALAHHYCSAWSELPWMDSDGRRQEDRRNVVLVAGTDPYAWKGTAEPPAEIHVRHLSDALSRDQASAE